MIQKKPGIYRIYCHFKNKEYIGSAVNLYQRMHHHFHHLKNNSHSNGKLQNYYNKYGKDSLKFEILEFCEKESLIKIEQRYLDKRKPFFNICKIAGNTLGRKHSEKTKQHYSKKRKGKYPKHLKGTNNTKEAREKISKKAKLRGVSKELVEAAKKANTGRKHTVEEIRKRTEKQTKITPQEAAEIKYQLSKGIRQIDLAKQYKVCQRTISRIKHSMGIFGDKDYYNAAVDRFNQETAQISMF